MRPEQYDVPFPNDDDFEEDDEDDEDDDFEGLTDFDDEDDDLQSTSRDSCRFNDHVTSQNGVFRRQRSLSECTSNALEPDDNRRDHHNQLERKRRASIKISYNDLREAIPSLRGSKASRAVILQRAVECIQELVRLNRDHTHCVETLRRQNDLLDSRVQELQRYVQRCDDEIPYLSYGSSFSSGSTLNGSLRLCPSTVHNGPGTSGLPVYRLLPNDSLERSNAANAVQTGQSLHNSSSIHSTTHGPLSSSGSSVAARSRVSYVAPALPTHADYTGISALSAAACLLSTGHSSFSSCSPSSGSNCDPAQSSSQRSSPGCLSSSSLSNSSSSNPSGSNSRTDPCEEQPLQIDMSCAIGTESTNVSSLPSEDCLAAGFNPALRCSSPPSILLSVPVRPTSTTASSTESIISRAKQSHQVASLDSPLKPNDLTKRRRIT